MKCKFCGEEIIIGSRFCSGCSAPIDYDEETKEKLNEHQQELEKKKHIDKIKKKIIRVLGSLIPLCVLCFIFITVFYDGSGNKFTTEKVTKMVSTVKENQQKNEENKTEEVVRIPVEMGESCSSDSYEITLQDADIVDKSYEKAIVYNFRSGEEFVFIKVSLWNKLYEDAVYSSLFQFVGRCDGSEVNQSKSGTLAEGNKFKSIDGLNSRRQTKDGFICYSLPEGWRKLEIDVKIDNIENEPMLIVENPKNRPISNSEIEQIIDNCEIEDFLYDNNLYSISDEDLYSIITDFMHLNCLSKTDKVPGNLLKTHIKEQVK